ncbi:mitochondrial outer membrane translocase complex, subunit Tom20 domain-containing protein [Scheffersomyces xylosifermentans]|uniref:mitochondrial outer membrane translocase complex, subunit Tom20 domain-containing protein n=1 Tax=Scheffersomyces xylosifermentans TaxID=1304137 RepID=UPI00315CDBC1
MSRAFAFTAVAATATVVGYAVWFDYQRRHSSEFRKALKKRAVKQQKLSEKLDAENKKNKVETLKKALIEDLAVNPIPTDLAEKESFFMQQVALGEQLAASPDTKIDAAICFYKALAVYPNPTDILGIYQRSVPEDVYELVVMMVAFKPPQSVANIVGEKPETKPSEDDLD